MEIAARRDVDVVVEIGGSRKGSKGSKGKGKGRTRRSTAIIAVIIVVSTARFVFCKNQQSNTYLTTDAKKRAWSSL